MRSGAQCVDPRARRDTWHRHLYAKLGVNDRAAAVAAAYDRGILG